MWTNEGPNLCLTADRSTVVPEGDPRARFLLVATGCQIPLEEAERYGLTGGATDAAKSGMDVAAAESETKRKADTPANKLKAEPPANKGKG